MQCYTAFLLSSPGFLSALTARLVVEADGNPQLGRSVLSCTSTCFWTVGKEMGFWMPWMPHSPSKVMDTRVQLCVLYITAAGTG